MKWKDTPEHSEVEDNSEEDYLDEETYSPWKRGSSEGLLSRIVDRSTMPIILLAVGVLIMAGVIWGIFSGPNGGAGDKRLQALEDRLGKIEERLQQSDGTGEGGSRLDSQAKKIEQLKGRFDRMEAALALRMDHISKKVEDLKKSKPAKTVAAPKKPAPKKIAKPVPKPVSEPTRKLPAIYHTVKKGETLYAVSRKYDLTVKQLRRMNNLTGSSLKVGQKLLIRPAGG